MTHVRLAIACGALVFGLGSCAGEDKVVCGGSDARFYDEGLIFSVSSSSFLCRLRVRRQRYI